MFLEKVPSSLSKLVFPFLPSFSIQAQTPTFERRLFFQRTEFRPTAFPRGQAGFITTTADAAILGPRAEERFGHRQDTSIVFNVGFRVCLYFYSWAGLRPCREGFDGRWVVDSCGGTGSLAV